jgi:hypothetical protein
MLKSDANDAACKDLFHYLIDSPTAIIDTLAPSGWESSPFVKVFHPDAGEVLKNVCGFTTILADYSKH